MSIMDWNYTREESNFEIIPVGEHRIRIAEVDLTTSKTSGNEMLSFKFDVSGHGSTLFHNIVFLKDRPQITNRNLTKFFDSFSGIPEGSKNLNEWVGKVGACTVKHEDYNGKPTVKVDQFIPASKQDSLPPWREATSTVTSNDGFITTQLGEEVPFTF